MKPTTVLNDFKALNPGIGLTDAQLKKMMQACERRVITDIIRTHEPPKEGVISLTYRGEATATEVWTDPSTHSAYPGSYYYDPSEGKHVFVLDFGTRPFTANDVVECFFEQFPDYMYEHAVNNTTEQDLIIPEAFADVYLYYLQWQTDFAQAEYERVQNSLALFNERWEEFARYYHRQARPIKKGFKYI